MKQCPKCGKEVADDAVRCPGCASFINITDLFQDIPATPPSKKSSSVSVILGIVSIICTWILSIAGHITAAIGIVHGVKEYKLTGKTTGLVLSIIGAVCSVTSSLNALLFLKWYF